MTMKKLALLFAVLLIPLMALAQTPIPEDSPIYTVNTGDAGVDPGKPPETFNLACYGTDTAIKLNWSGNFATPPAPTLSRSTAGPTGTWRPVAGGTPFPAANSGTYTDSGVSSSTSYWYRLNWGASSSTVTGPCQTVVVATGTDIPTYLNAWGVSPDTIYVNWKDNGVKQHTFELQRIKLTPKETEFYDDNANGLMVETVSASELRMAWKNLTNPENLKGPFYHVVERSTSTNPFADRDKDGKLKKNVAPANVDVSFVALEKAFGEDSTYTNKTKTTYEYFDTGLAEGTIYHYRLKACSLAMVDLAKDKKADPNLDPTEKACSHLYSNTIEQSATKPAAPSNLTVTSVGTNSVSLSWKDNSGGEDGFELLRDGAVVHTFNAPSAGKGVTMTYTDSGLSSGTTYTYTVRAYKFNPNYPGVVARRIFSGDSNSASATTRVTLTVGKSPAAGGTVSGSGVNCGSSCATELAVGDSVSLTASAAGGYDFEKWTGDACNNSGNTACSFTIRNDTSVTASFTVSAPLANETVSVVGLLNGTEITTNFIFSLSDPDGTTVASGPRSIPFSRTANYPVGGSNRFYFNYISGGPSGATFQQIKWSNAEGGGGPVAGMKSTGSGFVSADGSWLEYRVYFTNGAVTGPADRLYAKLYDSARDWLARGMESIRSAAATLWEKTHTAVISWFNVTFARYELQNVPGSGVPDMEKYFAQFKKVSGDTPSLNQGVFKDTGLESDTVYLYRVRTCYSDGTCSAWAGAAAGKTLPAGGTFNGKVGICTRNSFCELIPKYSVIPEPGVTITTEAQCGESSNTASNGLCRDVGTSRQFFEETR